MGHRRLLIVAFALAVVLTAVLGGRLVVSSVYWAQHRDRPIEPWMTVGMVARSYHVPRATLAAALDLGAARDRRTLAEIARATGRTEADVAARLNAAIAAARAGQPAGAAP